MARSPPAAASDKLTASPMPAAPPMMAATLPARLPRSSSMPMLVTPLADRNGYSLRTAALLIMIVKIFIHQRLELFGTATIGRNVEIHLRAADLLQGGYSGERRVHVEFSILDDRIGIQAQAKGGRITSDLRHPFLDSSQRRGHHIARSAEGRPTIRPLSEPLHVEFRGPYAEHDRRTAGLHGERQAIDVFEVDMCACKARRRLTPE